jgi:uncharacterized cupredoxin-like copper-binding protein
MPVDQLLRPLAVSGAVILTMAGCGSDDGEERSEAPAAAETPAAAEPITFEIDMKDELVYNPTTLAAKVGEKIRFVFKNTGRLAHDALIGDTHAQEEHEAAGGKDHESHHGDEPPPFVTVPPGGTDEIVYVFDTPGEIIIGCHQAGHFAAGMKLTVTVS